MLRKRLSESPNEDFRKIFGKLRSILRPYKSKFTLTANTESHYCLAIEFSPRFKKSFPIAWVSVSKSYVSYHFMPVYFFPALKESMSPSLRARMQGKSCFNFKIVDDELFDELEEFTARGFEMSKKAGVVKQKRR